MTNAMRNARLYVIPALLVSLFLFTLTAKGQTKPISPDKPAAQAVDPKYKDASLPIQDRVADLLPRMTLEEKVDQLASGWENNLEVIDPTGTFTSEAARKVILNVWGTETKVTPRQSAILRNGVQRYQREKTRLGIPVMFQGEALHGLMEYGSTSFQIGRAHV